MNENKLVEKLSDIDKINVKYYDDLAGAVLDIIYDIFSGEDCNDVKVNSIRECIKENWK